jgi:hypothetical protein
MMLQAEDFGIVGDGQTDNSPGLRALRDAIRAGVDRSWVVDFDPGHYCYTDNTWWKFGERDVTLRCNGARLECTSENNWARTFGLLSAASTPVLYAPDDVPFDPAQATLPTGYRFASADARAQSIALLDPVALATGEVVLLAGHIQQIREVDGVPEGWGWPPNYRVYEYAVVDSQDGNAVTLRHRLRNAYDDLWPDWLHQPLAPEQARLHGKPRLFLTHGDGWRQLRSLHIHDAVFAANRHKTHTPFGFTGRKFELIGCRTEGEVHTYMNHVEDFEARDCDFGRVEVDKINRRVSFDRCRFRGTLFSMGAGAEQLTLRDCDIMGDANGQGLNIAPRDVRFAGTVRVHGRTIFQNSPTVSVPGPTRLTGMIAGSNER